MNPIKSICVYCGSSLGKDVQYEDAARRLGKSIAEHDLRLIYGGGTRGLMGVIARSVRENGGEVKGIIPEFLLKRETSEDSLAHLDDLQVVADMHIRKKMMFDHSDAFIALPGGTGTLEEVIEMITWAQIGQHRKPVVLANVSNYWNPLTSLLDHMIGEGFIHELYDGRPIVLEDVEEIVPHLLGLSA